MNDIMLSGSVVCLVILLLMMLLKKFRQPSLVAYILAGIVLGPYFTGMITNAQGIAHVGELGILLLMFFLGMEINIPDQKNLLMTPLIAQSAKTILSFGFVWLIGQWQHWNTGSIITLSVLLIFNSTAVVSEYMRNNGVMRTEIGQTVLNILLLQDILLAPALTGLQIMGGQSAEMARLLTGIVISLLLFFLLRAIRKRNLRQLRLFREIENDHELQVFTGLLICIGFAVIAENAGMTGSVGSFAAGLLIGSTKSFHWLGDTLKPFKIFFVALFFISVGLSLNIPYVQQNYGSIILLTIAILVTNSILSGFVFRLLKYPWRESLYAGGLLSQTGEFGILSCSVAFQLGIIAEDIYKTAIAVTSLSLLCATIWMSILRKATDHQINVQSVQ